MEFKDVSFTYEGAKEPALSHVSFKAEPGQTVALVGPSGGGKTTAASLIPRFYGTDIFLKEILGRYPKSINQWPLDSRKLYFYRVSGKLRE